VAGEKNPSEWKDSIKEAVEDAMREVPVGETLVIDKIEVRNKSNPVHQYRIWLAPTP
jgi:hypothetical protein